MSVDKTLLKKLCICYVLKLVGVKSVTGEVLYLLMLQCCQGKISDRRGALFVDVIMLSVYKH